MSNEHLEMEHVGNFNYGATGAAAGIPGNVLERTAGQQQEQGANYDPANVNYWWMEPYEDYPTYAIPLLIISFGKLYFWIPASTGMMYT